MENILFATVEGRPLSTDEVLHLPPNTHIKIIVDTDIPKSKGDKGKTSKDSEKFGEQFQNKDGLLRLLRSWREDENSQEQKDTWNYLQKVLDEDRLSDRRLFP